MPQKTVYCKTQKTEMWDLSAKHRAGYTSHRKHFLSVIVAGSSMCRVKSGNNGQDGQKTDPQIVTLEKVKENKRSRIRE